MTYDFDPGDAPVRHPLLGYLVRVRLDNNGRWITGVLRRLSRDGSADLEQGSRGRMLYAWPALWRSSRRDHQLQGDLFMIEQVGDWLRRGGKLWLAPPRTPLPEADEEPTAPWFYAGPMPPGYKPVVQRHTRYRLPRVPVADEGS